LFAYTKNNPLRYIDPTGLDDVGFSPLPPVEVIVLRRETNLAGAEKGTLYVIPPRTVGPGGENPSQAKVAVPVVSGGGPGNAAPTQAGTYTRVTTEPVSSSGNEQLWTNHGTNYMPLPNTEGNAVHSGNQNANPEKAYTEGCSGTVATDRPNPAIEGTVGAGGQAQNAVSNYKATTNVTGAVAENKDNKVITNKVTTTVKAVQSGYGDVYAANH